MPESPHDKFMRRCLDLAASALGMTYPNPMVGAVIVHKNTVIGEGYHIRAGGPHAEVYAISSVTDRSLLEKSVLYVSLEPCSHHGKTPPCTDLIISSRIPVIVIGTTDTSSKVSGKGIGRLVDEGRQVVTGVLEDECRRINRRFFTFHEKKRPYVILKWAQSADGFIDLERAAGTGTRPYWITGNAERVIVHKWRSEEQSIMVGAGTARADDPSLNVRHWSGANPLRIVLSGSGQLDKNLALLQSSGTVIVFTSDSSSSYGNAIKVPLKNGVPAAVTVLEYLYNEGIQSLFIEGGAAVLNHFIGLGLWDEARIFSGFRQFGRGVTAPAIGGKTSFRSEFDESTLEVLLNEPD